jgi:hypothetical protein
MLHGGPGDGFGGAAAFGEVPTVENVTINEYGAPLQGRDDGFVNDDTGARDADFDDSSYSDDSSFSDDDSFI